MHTTHYAHYYNRIYMYQYKTHTLHIRHTIHAIHSLCATHAASSLYVTAVTVWGVCGSSSTGKRLQRLGYIDTNVLVC